MFFHPAITNSGGECLCKLYFQSRNIGEFSGMFSLHVELEISEKKSKTQMENCLPEAKFFHAMFVQKIPGNSPLCVGTTWTSVAGIFDHRRASPTLKGDENFKWKEIRLSIKAQLERYLGGGEKGAAANRAQHVTEIFYAQIYLRQAQWGKKKASIHPTYI